MEVDKNGASLDPRQLQAEIDGLIEVVDGTLAEAIGFVVVQEVENE